MRQLRLDLEEKETEVKKRLEDAQILDTKVRQDKRAGRGEWHDACIYEGRLEPS